VGTIEEARATFLGELIAGGLLVPSGVRGVYGRSATFEDVIERLDQLISRIAAPDGAEAIRFPPVINRRHFERSGFMKSMPQLAGSIHAFAGAHADHQGLLADIESGRDWGGRQAMTDVALTPAACYPVYPSLAGNLPAGGKLIDVFSYCFRHEPSDDPARMQIFRMRENVRIGTADAVRAWRETWLERGQTMIASLGLTAHVATGNDPFFGRGGRMLAANQREQELKFEMLVPINSVEEPTAIMSFNYHQDLFGGLYGINLDNGEVAHTACVGWGMERIALAMFKTHGLQPSSWPATVRGKLWP
jgi:seryl-tRNA synthetase